MAAPISYHEVNGGVDGTMHGTDRVIGLRAQKGGAICVAVTIDNDEPRLLLSTFLPTAAEGDRLAFEPYGVAREMALEGRKAEAAMAVAEGRRRQDEAAADELRRVVARLGAAPVTVALLINRAGWISDLLAYSLEWAEHVPVAEGLAVRDAFRTGCRNCGLVMAEVDEKSLPVQAADALGRSASEIDARLKAMGITAGRPWRKEQKLAALSAWMAGANIK